jgi:hypothetical protein
MVRTWGSFPGKMDLPASAELASRSPRANLSAAPKGRVPWYPFCPGLVADFATRRGRY